VGGRSLTWGGITLRLSRFEFQAGASDGHGPTWPIGNGDLDPYYSRLERLMGVHGQCDGLEQLPDGCYLPPLPFTPAEAHLREAIGRELGLPLIHSRGFQPHRPTPADPWPPSSAQGVTLARAAATGRLRLRSNAVVSHLRLDRQQKRATGVVMVDASDGTSHVLSADLVVLCASTIETVRILLNSSAAHRRGGLVDTSGCLGRFLIDHISSSRFFSVPGLPPPEGEHALSGAGSCFIPNTVNLERGGEAGFLRGYGIWAAMQRFDPPPFLRRRPREAMGFLIGHGEVLPREENLVELDPHLCDGWGVPCARISCRWGPNEVAMLAHMHQRMEEVVAAAGGHIRPIEDLFLFPLIEPFVKRNAASDPSAAPPGYYVHELGGARMASAPEHGVVNPWNQCWTAPNVLVTDGSCWPTAGWQSPTLTEMAITWRACEQAARRKSSL
jgi:choline dehydrogenase-like flavoprotein